LASHLVGGAPPTETSGVPVSSETLAQAKSGFVRRSSRAFFISSRLSKAMSGAITNSVCLARLTALDRN
jgi:hypothetical protein